MKTPTALNSAPPTPLRGAIVAMTRDGVIGVDGRLPWHYSEDLKRFRRRTDGCVVIMGRKTWDSLGRRALPGRRNMVISRGLAAGDRLGVAEAPATAAQGYPAAAAARTAGGREAEYYPDLAAAWAAVGREDAWIIGGAQLYHATMDRVNWLEITYVPDHIHRTDAVRLPPINWDRWHKVEESPLPGTDGLTCEVFRRHSAPLSPSP